MHDLGDGMPFGRWLVASAVAGTALGIVLPAATAVAGGAAAVGFVALAVVLENVPLRRCCLLAAILATAVGHGALARERALDVPLVTWFGEQAGEEARYQAAIDGQIVRDAEPFDDGARLLIDVRAVQTGETWHPRRGRIQTYVAGRVTAADIRAWTAGRQVRAAVLLRRLPMALNPGGPGERWQRLRAPAHLAGTIKSPLLVEVAAGRWWHEAAAGIRAGVRDRVSRLFPDPADPAGAVVVAILIGDRSALDDELERRLQVAGTYHIIAISGGNVALLTALLVVSLRLLSRSARVVFATTAAVVLVYGWIVGAEPSVARAVTAAVVYLACGFCGLAPRPLDVLATVALIVVIGEPMAVVDAGAWLSFGATFGIIAVAPRLVASMTPRRMARSVGRVRPATATTALPGTAGRWIAGLVAATLAAETAILPVTAALFTRVGVAGPALNLVAVPMIAWVQVAGMAAVTFSDAWPAAARVSAAVARWATRAIVESSALVDVAPWLSWRVPPPSPMLIAIFYGAGTTWLMARSPSRLQRGALVTVAVAAMAMVTAPFVALHGPARGWLRVTFADVGQGDAALIQLPSGQALLVDAGGRGARFDAGDRIVVPAAWASGVRRLEWLAFTHADLDHVGGAPAVASALRPREIWEGIPVPSDPHWGDLRTLATGHRAAWRQLQAGDRLEAGGTTIEVVSPARPDWERQRVRNADSLVLSIRYRDVEFLLTGDIGVETERSWPPDGSAAALRVLKVAHHGSRSSSSEAFLRAFRPQVAVVSAGRGNPFGHPSPEVVGRLRAVGAETFRTDRDGAVIVETDGRRLVVRTLAGREWRLAAVRRPV